MCFYNFDYFDTLNPLIMYQLGGTKSNNIIDYKAKYIKYKHKYLTLKKLKKINV